VNIDFVNYTLMVFFMCWRCL